MKEKIVDEIITASQGLPPNQRFWCLLLLFILVSLSGLLIWPPLINFFGGKTKKQDTKQSPHPYEAILLCDIIARDLAYGYHRLKSCNDIRTFKLARQALLAGITKLLGRKGDERTRACIFVPQNDVLVIDEADGYSAESRDMLKLKINETIAGEAFEKLYTRYCPDRTKDPGFKENPHRTRNYKSIVCVPIHVGYDIYGILNIDAIPANAFNDLEIKCFESYAKLIALSYLLERSAKEDDVKQEAAK